MCVISASYGELTQLRYNGGSSGHNGDVDMEPTVKAGVVNEVPSNEHVYSPEGRRDRQTGRQGNVGYNGVGNVRLTLKDGAREDTGPHLGHIITKDIVGTEMYNT